MGTWIRGDWQQIYAAGGDPYYTGDRAQPADIEVPARPSVDHQWSGAAWAVTLARAKQLKLAEIDAAYEAAMAGGFTSSALGTPHRYASSIAAQVKLTGAAISALAGDAVQYECTEIATGITAPHPHTITQMKQVMLDGKNRAVGYKLHQTDLHNQVAAIVADTGTTEAMATALVRAITPAFM